MVDIQSISDDLKLGDDGIWYSSHNESISYPSEGNKNCFAIEDRSFWFKHRNSCIIAVVRSFPPEKGEAIYDIGGGNGFVSLGLAKTGFEVVLVEPGRDGAFNGKKRGLQNVICATTETAKFKNHTLPAVGLFDVIEHIKDDLSFVKSIHKLIKPGGRLYVTVPSFSFLWSANDVSAGHYKRYSLREMSKVIKSAGFEIEFSTYIFRLLPIPIFIMRSLPYRIGLSKIKKKSGNSSRDHAVKGGLKSKIINAIMKSEIKNLYNRKSMKFGGSCLIVAIKS